MKKTILAALAALTFVSPASALELPEGYTCSDIFWMTKDRINPIKLSDYQECVLATTKPDETSGILGDLIWIQIDGIYYSTSMRLLRKSFTNFEDAHKAFMLHVLREKHNNEQSR